MEEPLDRLAKILDLLGPGLWLDVDRAAFAQFFGAELGSESAEVAARRYAESHGCLIEIDGSRARFGRAYPKIHPA